jgi:methyl-accepting chemotaxis protein
MARSSDSNFLLALIRDKTFQAREIRRVIGLSLVYLLITTALIGIFYHQMLGRLLEGMAPLLFVSEDMALANEAIPALSTVLVKWLLIMLAINSMITVIVSIYITRRLGQPILAIKRALNEIGNGNLDVRLRTSDSKEFGEIASALTAAMHRIRLQISAAKESVSHVRTIQDSDAGPANASNELDTALQSCKGALDFFQTDTVDPEFSLVDIDDDTGSNRVA